MATILSIQSQVVRGHVGNSVAQPVLQRLGHHVWAVPTVLLSNHPAHGALVGGPLEAARIAALLDALPAADAILSGYLGDAGNEAAITAAVGRLRKNAPGIYFCDPVFAHEAGLFVSRAVADAQARLVTLADIAKPNQTELADILGDSIGNLAEARAACAALRAKGPETVILSSLRRPETPDVLGTLAVGKEGTFLLETPRLPGPLHGAGDLFSALFLGFTLQGRPLPAALESAASAAFEVLLSTGMDLDLHLVPQLDRLAAPVPRFTARRL